MRNLPNEIDKAVPKWVYLLLLPIWITIYEAFTTPITPQWAMVVAYCSIGAFVLAATYYLLKIKAYAVIAVMWFILLMTIIPIWKWF